AGPCTPWTFGRATGEPAPAGGLEPHTARPRKHPSKGVVGVQAEIRHFVDPFDEPLGVLRDVVLGDLVNDSIRGVAKPFVLEEQQELIRAVAAYAGIDHLDGAESTSKQALERSCVHRILRYPPTPFERVAQRENPIAVSRADDGGHAPRSSSSGLA